MDILSSVTPGERGQALPAGSSSPSNPTEPSFARSIQNAARQGAQAPLPPSETRPAPVSPLTAEAPRAEAGAFPGVTPLSPAELNLRQTDEELRARRLLGDYAARMTAPTSLADYPPALVTYAGQLAAQTNRAGFSMPESSARAVVTPRRSPEARAVRPVEPAEGGHAVDPR
jgi:hypothetical protein